MLGFYSIQGNQIIDKGVLRYWGVQNLAGHTLRLLSYSIIVPIVRNLEI